MKHVTRPAHDWRHPVHVTMRRVKLAPSFRSQVVYSIIVAQLGAAKARRVRVVQYSIQHDHLHLMIEGHDRRDLSKQMCRLFSRIALAVNRAVHRRGSLFRDRHHRHDLATPTEVRNALVDILFDIRKHARRGAQNASTLLDAYSSAPWFDGWDPCARPSAELLAMTRVQAPASTTSRPRTWLAQCGWRRAGGPIRLDETPAG